METLIFKVLLSVLIAIGGAITESETQGAVTQMVGYDSNTTKYECKEVR